MVEREEVAPQLEVKSNGKIMNFTILFKYLGSCFSNYGVLQEDVKMRGIKTFAELKILFDVRSVGLGVKRELCEIRVVPTVTHGAEK